jgi:hypothetical protein
MTCIDFLNQLASTQQGLELTALVKLLTFSCHCSSHGNALDAPMMIASYNHVNMANVQGDFKPHSSASSMTQAARLWANLA